MRTSDHYRRNNDDSYSNRLFTRTSDLDNSITLNTIRSSLETKGGNAADRLKKKLISSGLNQNLATGQNKDSTPPST